MKKRWVSTLLAVSVTVAGFPVQNLAAPVQTEGAETSVQEEVLPEGEEAVSQEDTLLEGVPSAGEELYDVEETFPEDEETEMLSSADTVSLDEMAEASVRWLRAGKDVLMDDEFLKRVSSTSTDWPAFALGRLGFADNYAGFLAAADADVALRYAKNPATGLDKTNATEWHRLTMAVLASGGDPLKVGGKDLIADGVYRCKVGAPWEQGINGAAWALLALDSYGYETPPDAKYDRQALIRYLLEQQNSDGGWSIEPKETNEKGETVEKGTDLDITAMAVQALAPYYAGDGEVRTSVERALTLLRSKIAKDGDISKNLESTVQAVVAYCSLGIDPASVTSDSSDKSLIDGLMKYYNAKDGGFYHDVRGATSSNDMATHQALYGIAAYKRYLEGNTNLYDFREPADTKQYLFRAGETVYPAAAGKEASLSLPSGTKSVYIDNLPIGNYAAAQVQAGDDVWYTSYRRGDGSTPVESEIPVSDGTVFAIQVTRLDLSQETWTVTVKLEEDAQIKALIAQIDNLPSPEALTLADEEKVQQAKAAYDALSAEKQAEVTNYEKLTEALSRIQKLKEEDALLIEQKRKALAEKIEAVTAEISNKQLIRQYLQELDALGEWEEKAALKAKLDGYLLKIEEREALVEKLDQDIWNQVDPLRVTQKNTSAVRALKKRYDALSEEEQKLLGNKDSLLDASKIVEALAKGTVPAKVFQNMVSTKEDFTYSGTRKDVSYTLTFDADTAKTSKDVDARVDIVEGKDKEADNTVATAEFSQSGSLGASVKLTFDSGLDSGSYYVYYKSGGKLVKISTASVKNKKASFTVKQGGKYWITDGAVSQSGGVGSLQGQSGTKTTTNQTKKTTKKSSGGSSGKSSGTSGSSGSKAGNADNVSQSGIETIKASPINGMVKASEFASIKGKNMNLEVEGLLTDGVPYTMTFYGKDVKKPADFKYEISPSCEHEEEIGELADTPIFLCMAEAGTFPGKALVSLDLSTEKDGLLLFRYDEQGRKAEYVKKVTDEDDKLMFTVKEGGCYFISDRAKSGAIPGEEPEETDGSQAEEGRMMETAAVTGMYTEGQSPTTIAVSILTALTAAGAACILSRKKKKKEGITDEGEN